ncbi:MAG: hypothetical protein ACTS2F_27585 [Thainema sp.]
MNQPAPTRDELKLECYQLIDAIAAHRYGIKLLIAAKQGLMLYVDYKGNRKMVHNRLNVRKEG